MKKINIPAAFDRIDETWSPHIAARVNGQEVRLAKIDGAFEWHRHDGVEEAFFVVKGGFTMRFRAKDEQWDVAMEEGDFITVPAGVEHMPVAEEECWIMLIESAGALNTGEHVSARTRTDLPEL
ncbi:mannose-6-phosphate isomerase [Marinicaulis flavus]|uniref:Mannose-6-phosphate isomerase n=1 Tax=Hyphococcus luteus TaxID=2058213 RepID=A0A2S7K8R3_9PROT|nr:mannose-6-phosphate isomerase [Marinicaulis flavus]